MVLAFDSALLFNAYQKAKAEWLFKVCLGFELGGEAVCFSRVKFTQQINNLAESLSGKQALWHRAYSLFS